MMGDNEAGFKLVAAAWPRMLAKRREHAVESEDIPVSFDPVFIGGVMISRRGFFAVAALVLLPVFCSAQETGLRKFLYVAEPGVRDYLEFGGHGVIVFDMDNGFKFVKRIPTQ